MGTDCPLSRTAPAVKHYPLPPKTGPRLTYCRVGTTHPNQTGPLCMKTGLRKGLRAEHRPYLYPSFLPAFQFCRRKCESFLKLSSRAPACDQLHRVLSCIGTQPCQVHRPALCCTMFCLLAKVQVYRRICENMWRAWIESKL